MSGRTTITTYEDESDRPSSSADGDGQPSGSADGDGPPSSADAAEPRDDAPARVHTEPYAVRIRAKFTKQGPVRFLSHLDLLKCIERALRRCGLPVAYTTGFHKRIRISFGPALALGHASVCEWMDIDMADPIPADEVMSRLRTTLPGGLDIVAAREIPAGTKSLQAMIRRAVYRVELESAPPDLEARVDDVLAQQEIPLRKKNKTVNVRGFIDTMRVAEAASPTLEMTLGVGPEGSVRPEDVLAALSPAATVTATVIERTALLTLRDGAWQDP